MLIVPVLVAEAEIRPQKEVPRIAHPHLTSPAGCYTSPSSVLPYISLQLSCCSPYRNVASDNYLAVCASDACFEPTGTAQMRQQVENGWEHRGLLYVVSV